MYLMIYDLFILVDFLSYLRKFDYLNVICIYDLLFRSGLDLNVDFVICVGKLVIFKKLN